MKIKLLMIALLSLSSIALFGAAPTDEASKTRVTYDIKGLHPDTSNWITFPITYEYGAIGKEASGKENVQVSFPVKPQPSDTPLASVDKGLLTTYSAADKDGMTFAISAMQIPEVGYNMEQSLKDLVSQIEKNPDTQITAYIPPQTLDPSSFMIMWKKGDKMVTLKVVKGTHLVYFLETTVTNEIYRNYESIEQNQAKMDEVMKDALKSGAFFHSFATTNG